LEPPSDIDTIAENIVLLNNHVADVDANAKPDALLVRQASLAVDHPTLDLGGATHSVHHTGELCQETVAGVLDGTALVLSDPRVDQLFQMCLETLVGAFLVNAHQP